MVPVFLYILNSHCLWTGFSPPGSQLASRCGVRAASTLTCLLPEGKPASNTIHWVLSNQDLGLHLSIFNAWGEAMFFFLPAHQKTQSWWCDFSGSANFWNLPASEGWGRWALRLRCIWPPYHLATLIVSRAGLMTEICSPSLSAEGNQSSPSTDVCAGGKGTTAEPRVGGAGDAAPVAGL